MKPLLEFEEYMKKGIVKKQRLDLPRANFLIEEANKSFLGLKRMVKALGIDELNANSVIKDCNDIILELVRAKMLMSGYSCSGNFAHKAEVAYMNKLGFSKMEVNFVDEIRSLRNQIIYYGTRFDKEFAEKVYNFLIKIKGKLDTCLKE